ncbi:MAG: hypothetical protein IJS88_02500 [Alphaproteobacteria bacterium]|nr:hypothetical protein [Alphaproteobacteria bacterium]
MKVNQSGRSMIEMLGVLAIIGVLSVGGIAGYSKAMSKYRTNKVLDQVSMMITNIRTMYAQQQTYGNLDNSVVIDMGLVPEELVVPNLPENAAGKLRNIFGGRVFVGASSLDGAGEIGKVDKNAFIISFYGLTRDACIAMATADWGAGSSSGLLAMHIYSQSKGTTVDPTSIDATLDAVSKYTPGSITQMSAIAVPGDENVKVPLSVDQARLACYCPSKSLCAVSWKYY